MKKFNKNKLIRDIILGITRGNELSQLPTNVYNFHNSMLIRIIRVLLGTCFMLFILVKNGIVNIEYKIYIIILILTIIHILYMFIICIIRTYIIIKNIRNGKWKIYNSPFNFRASILSKVYLCVKGVCFVVGTGAATLAINVGAIEDMEKIEGMDTSSSGLPSPSVNNMEDIDISRSSIIDIEWIMEWFNGLDDVNKIIICSLILILCSIQLYLVMGIKNKINTVIDKKLISSNIKGINFVLRLKKVINNYMNTIIKFMIYFFIIFAIISLILVIIIQIW